MFVSVRYNESESHHLYHGGQCSQQQQQQQRGYQSAPASGEWTSCCRTALNEQRQQFQHAAQWSMSPRLDHCNAILPACSWRQLGSKTASSAVQIHGGGWHQTSTSCGSALTSTRSHTLSTHSGNSAFCYYNSLRPTDDCRGPSDVQLAADSAGGWYADEELNTHQLMGAGNGYQQVRAGSQTASCCQGIWPTSPGETVSGSTQQSPVDEFPTSSSTLHSQLTGSVRSRPTQCTVRHRHPRRTKDALVPLIIRAILSAADGRLSLSDICVYIRQHSVDYAACDDEARWHNNVRHTLSHYEFFVKCGRVPTGRGNYWTVHPVCRAAFAADDFRIKRARHAVQLYEKSVNVAAPRQHPLH